MALGVLLILSSLMLWTAEPIWSAPTDFNIDLMDNINPTDVLSMYLMANLKFHKLVKTPIDEEFSMTSPQNHLYNLQSKMHIAKEQLPENGIIANIANIEDFTEAMTSVTETTVMTTNVSNQDEQEKTMELDNPIKPGNLNGNRQKRTVGSFWSEVMDTLEYTFESNTMPTWFKKTTARPYWRLQFKNDAPDHHDHRYPVQYRPAPLEDELHLKQFV